MKRITLLAIISTASLALAQNSDDVMKRAMHDELNRSMKKLQLESLPKPYFISYRVVDRETQNAHAILGGLENSGQFHSRSLSVSVRVGDYNFDSSNFLSMSHLFGGNAELPLDDNYDEIRRQIWLATDSAYKKALEDLSGKRAALQNKTRPEEIPDFTKGTPQVLSDVQPPEQMPLPEEEAIAKRVSAIYKDYPALQTSTGSLSIENVKDYFITSEGTDIERTTSLVSLNAHAETQATDGTPMSDGYVVHVHHIADLPTPAVFEQKVRDVAKLLSDRTKAARLSEYNGPVLFEAYGAVQLFADHFAGQLAATPPLLSDNPGLLQALRSSSSGLSNKIGARVMPEFVSITDKPSYKVDDEGTPAQETHVVENGILKTLLTSREPVHGVLHSTGNFRGYAAPTNLIVTSSKSVSREDLHKQLMEMVKSRSLPYGLIVRKCSNNFLVEAYRVYPDGHEEMIRKAEPSGFTTASFKEITAVSNQPTINYQLVNPRQAAMFVTGSAALPVLVSYSVPDLLFEDLSVMAPDENVPKLPVVPRPN